MPIARPLAHRFRFYAIFARTPEGLPVLSPSAIEQYLYVPLPLVRAVVPSTGGLPTRRFGPRELGNFAHEVFAHFYDGLAGEGVRRVSAENIEALAPRFEALVDELVAGAVRAATGTRASSAANAGGAAAAGAAQTAVGSQPAPAGADARRATKPALCEHAIEVSDAVDYAGVRLRGRIDRVDVDAERGTLRGRWITRAHPRATHQA